MPDLVAVRLFVACGVNVPREVCGFPREEAARLVREGKATYDWRTPPPQSPLVAAAVAAPAEDDPKKDPPPAPAPKAKEPKAKGITDAKGETWATPSKAKGKK